MQRNELTESRQISNSLFEVSRNEVKLTTASSRDGCTAAAITKQVIRKKGERWFDLSVNDVSSGLQSQRIERIE